MGEDKWIQGLWGKPERKRPFGRPRHICDIIKMDLKEIGWEGVDWIPVALDTPRVVEEICCEGMTGLHRLKIGCRGGIL
jgi:hypothetical protein